MPKGPRHNLTWYRVQHYYVPSITPMEIRSSTDYDVTLLNGRRERKLGRGIAWFPTYRSAFAFLEARASRKAQDALKDYRKAERFLAQVTDLDPDCEVTDGI